MAARKNRGTKNDPMSAQWKEKLSDSVKDTLKTQRREELAKSFPQALDVVKQALEGAKVSAQQWKAAELVIGRFVPSLQTIDSNIMAEQKNVVVVPETSKDADEWAKRSMAASGGTTEGPPDLPH